VEGQIPLLRSGAVMVTANRETPRCVSCVFDSSYPPSLFGDYPNASDLLDLKKWIRTWSQDHESYKVRD
jgi:hypothetical protein